MKMKERYHVTGMTCSACSAHVEKAVGKLSGIEKVSVNLLAEIMEVTYEDDKLGVRDITAAVEKAGYGAELIKGTAGSQTAQTLGGSSCSGRNSLQGKAMLENRAMKRRLGISIAFLVPLMYVAMFHMFETWFGVPTPRFVMQAFHGTENAMNFALTQFLLVLPILYVNRKFFEVGFKSLAHRSPNMDSLIAMGASAAVGYGIFAMYRIGFGLGHENAALVERYSGDLYFESAGTILTLITVGKYLESRSKRKTGEAITKLMDLSPDTAILLTESGEEKEVPTDSLQKGDVFLVKPGASIPVDGVVLEGSSSVDEALITGESIPVEKREGDTVVSAALNKAGFLKCRAERVGEDTTLFRIIRLVEEAGASKAPIARLADKVAGVFVPAVIGLALVTLAGWLLTGAGTEFAISSAIAVLVISCPCALGLATPVAIMVGTGVGARNGILIKSGEALQLAQEIDTVVLDKTGTITEGKLKVMQVISCGAEEQAVLAIAAALESRSEHPLAEAVVGEEKMRNQKQQSSDIQGFLAAELITVTDFKAVFGRGIEGDLSAPGLQEDRYFVGNQSYLEQQGIVISPKDQAVLYDMTCEGQTALCVADSSRLLGIIGVADTLKESSSEAVEAWRKMGVDVIMLTGDNRRTAEAVCSRLRLTDVVAEVLPQDKEQKIRELKRDGRKVAMIGDGINDAPALAAADVGMAIGAGTDVAIESADIILMKNDLKDAVTAMRLSRAVIRNIKENLFWAFFYNCVGIPLAAGLFYPLFELRLSPMFGAAAMSFSSIFVVGNALRLRQFKSWPADKRSEKENVAEMIEKKGNRNQTEKKGQEKSMEKVMTIEGMMCGHCTGRVQKVLNEIPGVTEVAMSLEAKTATVKFEGEVSDEVLTAAVTDAGYEVTGISALDAL